MDREDYAIDNGLPGERPVLLTLRVSPVEADMIRQAAKDEDRKLGTWLRRAVLSVLAKGR